MMTYEEAGQMEYVYLPPSRPNRSRPVVLYTLSAAAVVLWSADFSLLYAAIDRVGG
jgi:hypothetical protein